eukprot:g32641.t1
MESYWPVVEDECKAVAEFQIKGQAAVVHAAENGATPDMPPDVLRRCSHKLGEQQRRLAEEQLKSLGKVRGDLQEVGPGSAGLGPDLEQFISSQKSIIENLDQKLTQVLAKLDLLLANMSQLMQDVKSLKGADMVELFQRRSNLFDDLLRQKMSPTGGARGKGGSKRRIEMEVRKRGRGLIWID